MALPLFFMPMLFGVAPSKSGPPPRTALPPGPPPLSARDRKAIQALMGALDHDWGLRQVDSYLSHLSEDVEVISQSGALLRGKAALEKQVRRKLEAGLPERFIPRTRIESLRPVARGVVVLVQHREEGPRTSRATFVLSRQATRWRVQSISVSPVDTVPTAPARLRERPARTRKLRARSRTAPAASRA
ncbi:nuclear transport factor 2 family protein [Myxococcaceae bacterium JPH2]|nr:nuclear transport factor 2 family protein [Myxococcaceae bacterium JPH2]